MNTAWILIFRVTLANLQFICAQRIKKISRIRPYNDTQEKQRDFPNLQQEVGELQENTEKVLKCQIQPYGPKIYCSMELQMEVFPCISMNEYKYWI